MTTTATTPAAATATTPPDATSPVVLRGTGRGLEILLTERATLDEVLTTLTARFEASPGFFAGNDVTVRLNGARLAPGALAQIDALCARYRVRIAEVRAGAAQAPIVSSAPVARAAVEPAGDAPGTARMHVGPVRSGVVLAVPGDLVVLGDVNPGAEVRAGGNITVMGTLRGLAHAAYEGNTGYVVALRLDAQQIRIGALIARAGDGDGPSRGAEIAYVNSGKIAVESYQGKLPAGAVPPRR